MKIYAGIESIEKPETDYKNYNYELEEKREQEYVKKVVKYAKLRHTGNYVGKELQMSVADGYARYIVISEKPMALVHLDLGDGYDHPYIHRLTAKDVKDEIDRSERLGKIFADSRARQAV